MGLGDKLIALGQRIYYENILGIFSAQRDSPLILFSTILDLAIVLLLLYFFFRIVKGSRAWQLIKGIALLFVATWLSEVLNLQILRFILTGIMNWGVIAIIVIFQPELRRGLEQLGTTKFAKFFGMEKDIITRTKEDIYKIVIAAAELSKMKHGALIVIERDINIEDIVATGIAINAEVTPQLLVNIFEPRTPLHDGAVIISNNRIKAASCVLPLSEDNNITKGLGTRHRAAIGVSKESDSIVVIVSEETGRMSIAKDGTLIADVKEDVMKKILINNILVKRFDSERKEAITNWIKNKKAKEQGKNEKHKIND